MNIEALEGEILDALRERGHSDTEIKGMSLGYAFSEYCEWHGLCGWGHSLLRVIDELKEASSHE